MYTCATANRVEKGPLLVLATCINNYTKWLMCHTCDTCWHFHCVDTTYYCVIDYLKMESFSCGVTHCGTDCEGGIQNDI
jgi:hypothetical protein